jgi:hypothetical protein
LVESQTPDPELNLDHIELIDCSMGILFCFIMIDVVELGTILLEVLAHVKA